MMKVEELKKTLMNIAIIERMFDILVNTMPA